MTDEQKSVLDLLGRIKKDNDGAIDYVGMLVEFDERLLLDSVPTARVAVVECEQRAKAYTDRLMSAVDDVKAARRVVNCLRCAVIRKLQLDDADAYGIAADTVDLGAAAAVSRAIALLGPILK